MKRLLAAAILALTAGAQAPADTAPLLKEFVWRPIGPVNMGGRIDDIEAVESDPATIYVGAATSGVWKTVNNGTTWAADAKEAGREWGLAAARGEGGWRRRRRAGEREGGGGGRGKKKKEKGGGGAAAVGRRGTRPPPPLPQHPQGEQPTSALPSLL